MRREPARPGRGQSFLWSRALVLGAVVVTLGWFSLQDRYYRWMLSRREAVNVVVLCDTSPFRVKPRRALILYDRLALSPLCVALGVCQNRPSRAVFSFLPVERPVDEMTEDALRVRNVPAGPLVRVAFDAGGGTNFYVSVSDRSVVAGEIRVTASASWPGVSPTRIVTVGR